MQESSKNVVADLLNRERPSRILDAPSGNGWLAQRLAYGPTLLGVDLYASQNLAGYEKVIAFDLNEGLPTDLGEFDACCCCEGIEHLGNPLLLLRSLHTVLRPGGLLLATTPNVWYPAARLQYLLRGAFPSFPILAGQVKPGEHQHIMPWSFPQLHHYLKLAGFASIHLHEQPLSRAKHLYEYLLGLPQRWYCKAKARKTTDQVERDFWRQAGSAASVYGRHMIVTARK